MLRIVFLLFLQLAGSTGCVMPHGGGFGHSSSGMSTPICKIPEFNGEPAVLLLVEGIHSTEVKKSEQRWNGSFQTKTGEGIEWLYQPMPNSKSKTGIVMICKVDPQDPDANPKPALFTFDTKNGKGIMIRMDGEKVTAKQVELPDAKLKDLFTEYRSGMGVHCATLGSEETWKVAAGIPALNQYLQDVQLREFPENAQMSRNVLKDDLQFQSLYQSYLKKEGPSKRAVNFYYLATAFQNLRESKNLKFTQQEVLNYLGEPDKVTEFLQYDPQGQRTVKLDYGYVLKHGGVKGQVVNIGFHRGIMNKYDYHPIAQPE
jgi:hypothetical protein